VTKLQVYASEIQPINLATIMVVTMLEFQIQDDRYINEPEKGPAFRTQEYMSGYDGFESCEEAMSNGNCDSSYPDVCIASPPPDLNCNDVSYKYIKVEGGR
jgi:hypothetical protein